MTDETAPQSFSASAPAAAPDAIGRKYTPPTPASTDATAEPLQPATAAAHEPADAAPELSASDREAEVLDSTFWDNTVHAGRYSLENAPQGVETSHEQELAVRELFVSEQLPPSVGKHLSTLWNRALANPPTPEANTAAARQVEAQLTATARGAETIKLAQQEVDAIAKRTPAVRGWLEQSGMGNDRWLIEHLANRARARANRAARRAK